MRQQGSVGTIDYDGGKFLIEAEPHVVLRLKRVFPKIEKSSHGVLRLTNTPDVCRDIEWFLARYPMDVRATAARHMRAGAMEYRERMTVVEALLAGSARPRPFDLEVPLREYQRVAAEIALRTGGLLLADDVGLGKAQPLEEPVLTPRGWVPIGDLVVGDEVVDPDGGVGKVTAVHDRGMRQSWRVTLMDGEWTECCDEHLWLALPPHETVPRVVSLSTIHQGWDCGEWWRLPALRVQPIPQLRSWLTVDSIAQTSVKPMRCIAVDTRRNLYITRGHIVTHNTASAIGMISDPRARPALVVTLAHLPRQWEAELRKFAPKLRTHVLKKSTPYDLTVPTNRGRRRASDSQLPLMRELPDVIIGTYHKLDGWATTLSPVVRSVVYDECQELRRGHKSMKGSAAAILSEAAVYRLGLSATPVYNYGAEIFNVIESVRPSSLGDFDEFQREWCGGAGGGQAVRDPRALGAYLREQGIMLRRTRVDVGRELPPISHVPYEIDHDTAELAKVHGDIEALARILLADTEAKKGDRMQAAGEIDMRLRQATGLSKAQFVADWVRLVVEGGQKVVLFGWHRAVYDVWMQALAPLRPVLYTGTETATQKAAARDAFVDGDAQVLVMSLRSGAGLDGLQKVCSTVVFGELDWSPGVHEQCVGRVARDGQTQPVFAYYLLASDGSDPVVSDVLGIKKGQIAGIRDDAAMEAMEQAPEGRVRELARAFLGREP